jgi:hypothetical protein
VTSVDQSVHGEPSSTRHNRVDWLRVIAWMLLIMLPGQLIGAFVADMALPFSVLRDRPELVVLLTVGSGLVAGIGIGLLLRPSRDQLLSYALVGAAVAVAASQLLIGVARTRAPGPIPPVPLSAYLRDALILIVVQSAAAVPLWWARGRAAARSGNR